MDEKDMLREDGAVADGSPLTDAEPTVDTTPVDDAAEVPAGATDETADEHTAEVDPAIESESGIVNQGEAEIVEAAPTVVYRWTYADQAAHDAALMTDARQAQRAARKRHAWLYVMIVMSVFLLSFAMLIGALAYVEYKGGSGYFDSSALDNPHMAEPDVAAIEFVKESVVAIEATLDGGKGRGIGTGIIWTSDGYIITNAHIVEDAERIRIYLYDGTYATADLIGMSKIDDIAVLKIDRHGLRAATFAESACYVGQPVYAVGTPASLDYAWTTTLGVISYVNREVKVYDDNGTLERKMTLLQTDTQVNPGNSGGPLVNYAGEIVGVVTMKLAQNYEGIGFAIPAAGAVTVAEAILDGTLDGMESPISTRRPLIGIKAIYLDEGTYAKVGDQILPVKDTSDLDDEDVIEMPVSGVYVTEVTEGTHAVGKLEAGDIIIAVNGYECTSMSELSAIIDNHDIGDVLTLTVYRGGSEKEIDVELSAEK